MGGPLPGLLQTFAEVLFANLNGSNISEVFDFFVGIVNELHQSMIGINSMSETLCRTALPGPPGILNVLANLNQFVTDALSEEEGTEYGESGMNTRRAFCCKFAFICICGFLGRRLLCTCIYRLVHYTSPFITTYILHINSILASKSNIWR